MGRSYADRPGAARHHQSVELDPLRHAPARRAHSHHHAALVLGADSLVGRGVLLCTVPRFARRTDRIDPGRIRLRACRIRGAYRLAADSHELDLGSPRAPVLPADRARPCSCRKRRALRRRTRHGIPQRTSRRAHVHRGAARSPLAGIRRGGEGSPNAPLARALHRSLRHRLAPCVRRSGAAGHRVRQAIAAMGRCSRTPPLGTARAL